jgi:hypothetical protein
MLHEFPELLNAFAVTHYFLTLVNSAAQRFATLASFPSQDVVVCHANSMSR